jgi:hypothetical protein
VLHRSPSGTAPLGTQPIDHLRPTVEAEQVHGLPAQECLVGVRAAFDDGQQVIKEPGPFVSTK